jgi:hypothetical protein
MELAGRLHQLTAAETTGGQQRRPRELEMLHQHVVESPGRPGRFLTSVPSAANALAAVAEARAGLKTPSRTTAS